MARGTLAQEKAARAKAVRGAQRRPAAATPLAPLDGESPSPDVLPAPPPGVCSGESLSSAAGSPTSDASLAQPPGVASGSAEDAGGVEGTGAWRAHHARGSPVACGACGKKGRHFKMESIWDCGAQEPVRSSAGPAQCLPTHVSTFRMVAADEQYIMSARILLYLWEAECPECGCVGMHDGDCTRDWWDRGRGLFGSAPPFKGTELLGLKLLASAILARKTLGTLDWHASSAARRDASGCTTDASAGLQD